MVLSKTAITIPQNGSSSVSVSLSGNTGSATITPKSSNAAQVSVSPNSVQTVTGSASVTFSITVKKQSGSVTFTSSPSCNSPKVVTVTVP
jgi:hypothetical protein